MAVLWRAGTALPGGGGGGGVDGRARPGAAAGEGTPGLAGTGWPLPTGLDTGAVTLVLASAVAGVAGSAEVAVRAAAASRALRALIHSARQPVPPVVREAAAALGCAARLDVVAGEDAFAVTYGLIRPRILVSAGLARALTRARSAPCSR